MDNVANKKRPNVKNNSHELEKFARRLIRAVARMLVHEKRDETEVWEGLKKETGFDCKSLWDRMHALTLKKLDRLLNAHDQVDRLPKAARMTITDWLLFDTVIAHQDYDVIGVTDTTTEDRKVLVDLFELVEKHKLELLAGDRLADAWSTATIEYNNNNRQCTPMLLQRRWYQLKLATRSRFYLYWSQYKGVIKRLPQAEPYKPTPLQTTIAKRYKPLVVTPFMSWEDLIKNKLVILPDEFEIKGSQNQDRFNENSPDVLCLEPNVETINLANDSDTELEYRKPLQNDDLATITIKQEPKEDEMDVDESIPHQSRQDRIACTAEAILEATNMELEQICLSEDITAFLTSNKGENIINLEVDNNEHLSSKVIANTSNETETANSLTEECNNISCTIEDQSNKVSKIATEYAGDNENNEIILKRETAMENDVEFVKVTKEEDLVLPQITSVIGSFNESNESLSKISLSTAQITNNSNTIIIENDPDTDKSLSNVTIKCVDSLKDSYPMKLRDKTDNVNDKLTSEPSLLPFKNSVAYDLNTEFDIKPEINTWFGELSNDIDFVDDGIQLLDDGISYQDEEYPQNIGEIKPAINFDVVDENEIKMAKKEDPDNDHNKFDKKLLMFPVVYTVKLDDMGILPIHLLQHVDNKILLDFISSKSKVVLKDVDTISKCDEIIENIKKIKQSSYLLQKPRSRTYNPIQLCKNPDFNTRLKRLNVGFFSSSRNRLLLKACQPVTIDVSKAFEDKLINGTLYLKAKDDEDSYNKNNSDHRESRENNSVLPSAMPAQSLIDNTKGEILVHNHPINTEPVEETTLTFERSKVINLPDIFEIRRINQKLLTAQVTPIQSKNGVSELSSDPVSSNTIDNNTCKAMTGPASRKIMMGIGEENKPHNSISSTSMGPLQIKNCTAQISPPLLSNNIDNINNSKALAGPASRKRMMGIGEENKSNNSISNTSMGSNQLKNIVSQVSSPDLSNNIDNNINTSKGVAGPAGRKKTIDSPEENRTNNNKLSRTGAPWKSRQIRPEISWNNCNRPYTADTLLALDTLNRMLCLLTEGDQGFIYKPKTKKSKGPLEQITKIISNNNETSKNNDTGDVEVINETEVNSAEAPKIPELKSNDAPVAKRRRKIYCCWARERITQMANEKKRIAKHKCPFPLCLCCCKYTLLEYFRKAREERINVKKPPAWINTLSILEDHAAKETNVTVAKDDVSADVAELIPVQSTSAPLTVNEKAPAKKCTQEIASDTSGLCSDRSSEIASYSDTSKSDEIVEALVCSDAPIQNVVENDIEGPSTLGAEVSVITSGDAVKSADGKNAKNVKTTPNVKIHYSSKNHPYFRVKSPDKITKVTESEKSFVNPHGRRALFRITSEEHKNKVIKSSNIINKLDESNHGVIQVRNKFYTVADKPLPAKSVNITGQSNSLQIMNSSQKKIYLNSKHIAELPSDNPIHLGKNKILLTNLKYPLNFKAFEAYQRNLRQTMALPKGITLILQLDGRLTYKRDPGAVISNEFIAAMPHLIEAIQQEIDRVSHMPPLNPYSDNEIICLSDDETSNVTTKINIDSKQESIASPSTKFHDTNRIDKDNYMIEKCLDASQLEIQSYYPDTGADICNSQDTTAPTEINTSAINKSTTTVLASVKGTTDDNITGDIMTKSTEIPNKNIELCENAFKEKYRTATEDISSEINAGSSETLNNNIELGFNVHEFRANDRSEIKNIPSETNLLSAKTPNNDNQLELNRNEIRNNSSSETKTISPEINVESSETLNNDTVINKLGSPTNEIPKENIDNKESEYEYIENNKTKNILSDLMAMSGISPIEIAQELPIEDTITEKETPQVLSQDMTLLQDPMQLQNSALQYALTPITSLSELKYACLHNASFYKLDLDTRLLLPINVCMKSLFKPRAMASRKRKLTASNETMIDLTQDDGFDVPTSGHNSFLVINESSNNSELSMAGTNVANESTCYTDQNIVTGENKKIASQTVKPLKLFSVRSSLLRRPRVDTQNKIILYDINKRHDPVVRRRIRKQRIDYLDHKDTINENSLNTEFGAKNVEVLDSSSDEEPLAKIATKKRQMEKEIENKNSDEQINDRIDTKSTEKANDLLEENDKTTSANDLLEANDDITETNDLPEATDETTEDANRLENVSIDSADVFMEYLDEELLNEDEEDDACILGV